jgi:pyruvate formate lyase activating enzyme
MAVGRIFNIQRFCLHDGPGIRTTVFFKGCPLRCLWCGNPESISPTPLLSYLREKCIACGACVTACPKGALSTDTAGKVVVHRKRCTPCGICAETCDAKALEMVGREASVEEVLAVVLRDREYFEASGGGMTLSGGEPLEQPDFAERLLGEAKVRGLHSAVETSGAANWEVFERLLAVVDLWLYDFKETDPKRHLKYTGFWNSQILANLRRLHAAGAKIRLRCPMIPGYNARPEHLDGIAALARELPKLEGVELLPYYDLWRAKLTRLGLETSLPDSLKPPDRATVESWKDHLRRRGVRLVGITRQFQAHPA